MRHFFCLTTCLFSCLGLYATDVMNPKIDILEHVLVPQSKILSKENLLKGVPIYAMDIKCILGKSSRQSICEHEGHYVGGIVLTTIYCFSSSNGSVSIQKPAGYQYVVHQDDDGGKISESTIWHIETIEGKQYIVHFHEDFIVYSSSDDQFVVAS